MSAEGSRAEGFEGEVAAVGACGGYVPRRPHQTVLHRAVREGMREFLEEADGQGGLPAFVVKELNAFLRCGDLTLGFVRVRCSTCQSELRIGFSCKGRTVCSSCTGHRAALTAAHLVDDVLPRVPIRQWTMVKPRVHLTRYFGVFGPNARARAQVVPARIEPLPPPRLDWALLLRRTFGFDVLTLVTSPVLARQILGLSARPRPRAVASKS